MFIRFFAGVLILALTGAIFHAALSIHEKGSRRSVRAVLMQTGDSWQQRMDAPVPLEFADENFVKNHLIIKFVSEYLSVIPGQTELPTRSLTIMTTPGVMAEWRQNIFPVMSDMARSNMLRTIHINPNDIRLMGDYYAVPFTSRTWTMPNQLGVPPTIDTGQTMFLKVIFNKRVRDTMGGRPFDAGRFLDRGGTPMAIFEFRVEEAMIR